MQLATDNTTDLFIPFKTSRVSECVASSSVVVKVLCCKPEGCRFETR
jgi:hypothetical protein